MDSGSRSLRGLGRNDELCYVACFCGAPLDVLEERWVMRSATIRIERDDTSAMTDARRQFLDAWSRGDYHQGEVFSFELPTALFRVLTPKRWELLERLQCDGPLGIRALARALERDVKRVHEDAQTLMELRLCRASKRSLT